MNKQHRPGRAPAGMTVIELLMVLAVIGILAALAYPSYQDSVRKSRRADAKAALGDLAARQEQFFQNNKTYASTPAQLGVGAKSAEGHYGLTVTPGAAVGGVVTSYVLTATVVGAQAADQKCLTFTLNSQGVKGSTPAGNNCW